MAYYAPFYQPNYYQPTQTRQEVPQYNPQFQQAMASTPQPQQNNNGLIWVQGEAGAKSYLVAPNNTVMLMDSEGERFYLKSADASGMPMPLRVFDYKERLEAPQRLPELPTINENINLDNFITREEFEQRIAYITPQTATKKTAPKVKEDTDNG